MKPHTPRSTRTDTLFPYTTLFRSTEISLSMPRRPEQYVSSGVHPIFQMNLPEGYVLDRLRQRLAKTTVVDAMLLLALTGREAAIGRVHVTAPHELADALAQGEQAGRGERRAQILAWDGAEHRFGGVAKGRTGERRGGNRGGQRC